ncbi:VOC family protein [Dawidia soli]|uniref:VOC family protein n=1 Tax=Dawidia soli TaxID=2782352 RepID=A0AAP2DB07_9BACT|nr:VOC family protein [Dawidia soli]MBT1688648.1 VOC family protein [Dawidia soli]
MKWTAIPAIVLFAMGLSACSNGKTGQEKENTQNHRPDNMKNIISIVEIPVTDLSRSIQFYQAVLGMAIEEVDMGGTRLGVLPGGDKAVNVVLVKSADYTPATVGVVVYLNAGDDLQPMLDNVAKNGGQVIVPKTEISPAMGYFAFFLDVEGNKIGLHSRK